MRNSSFLIRFIDIGLIILFGFISVSDIENLSRISVGEIRDDAAAPMLTETERIVVNVGPHANFSIDQGDSESADDLDVITGSEAMATALEAAVESWRGRGAEDPVVVINPHPDSFVQHTVDVMDVCSRLGISRTLAR